MKRIVLLAALFGLVLPIAGGVAAQPESSRDGRPTASAIKVLFLGDQGHHHPSDRAAQLTPVLAGRGIDVTYTENLADLNTDTLARYDALAIYANINDIRPEQEAALVAYVTNGGGFVPIHCASYCFLNSPRYIALVGAQFQRHGTGQFDTNVVDAAHPIIKGLVPFHTWDETYVHTKHNAKDRHVLQTRTEGKTEEPWTWVRTEGKGRVFYTAYGHDARTWQEPGFHDLIERGIRWATAKGDVFDSRSRVAAGLPPFRYEESPGEIPNYLPGQRWGTQGAAIHQMQKPLEPAESIKHLVVPPGFEPRLFAAEPEIYKPLCMTWDDRGRLWIAESTDYPNTKRRDGQGRDRISILEDKDGDGKADSFTVFAEGLNIPTSMLYHDGGVIILQAPDTLFLKDTNGDGKADVRKVLFTGWGIGDTHAGPSNLRWGLDNWVWGIVGYSRFDGKVGGETHSFSQGLYRFKPDGSKLEFVRSTNNNSWGVGFSEEGLVFGSTANGCPSVYMPIANRYYEAVRGRAPARLESIAASNRFYPVTDKVRQVDFHGGFTAAAGHALYTARTYPRQYWNETAFVTEPTGHLVATFTLERKGSDFADFYGWNLVASDDEWTAPIAAEVGPDGHVWVIDWYNFIVQHNPTPHGFSTGRGNAYETPVRDKTHGRIYRIVYKAARPEPTPVLDPGRPENLVAALRHGNQFWRLRAQRLLIERGKTDVVPALIALVRDTTVDAIGLNPGAIHALWTLEGLGALSQFESAAAAAVVDALKHPSAGARRNAIQVLPRDARSADALISAGLLKDPDAQVRLAAFLGLADQPPRDEAGVAVAEVLRGGLAANDPWLPDAAIAAGARNAESFLKALAARGKAPLPAPALLIADRVAEHWARGGPVDSVGSLLASLSGGEPAVNESILRGLARGWPKNRPARLDGPTAETLTKLTIELNPAARAHLVRLAGAWGDQALDRLGAEIAATMLASVKDDHLPVRRRIEAARQLIELRPGDEQGATGLLELITLSASPELAGGLVDAVSASKAPRLGGAFVAVLPRLSPSVRSRVLRILLGRTDWAPAFVAWLEADPSRLSELALDQKQALAGHPNPDIAARAKTLLAKGGGLPDRDRQVVIDRLMPQLEHGGAPARGKLVYQQQCAKCHRHNGEGGQVGPDLSGVAAIPRREILINILDPSRSVEGNFVQYTVAANDGRVISGLLASESTTSIELIDAEGKRHTLLREDIDQMAASKKSLMPEGFEKQVDAAGLNDLLAFLTQRSKYRPLDLSKAATIVSTRGMFEDADAVEERLVFGDWSPKIVEGVPFVLVDPKGDKVPNVVLLHGPQGKFPPTMPRSVDLACNSSAQAIHFLSGVSGWGFPYGRKGSVSLTVRLHYVDGQIEDHKLENGVQFADYIRVVDVPGSKLAFRLGGQQIRYLRIEPRRKETIERIELVKGPDATAPVVMAVTIEAAGND
jgi:uncharacterized protein